MGFLHLVEARWSRWRTGPSWARSHGLCSTGLQSSAAPSSLVSSLSLLVQETEPCGPLDLCPLPLKGGGGPGTSHGDPSCPLIGRKEEWCGGEWSPPQASGYGCWWGREAREASVPRSAGQVRPGEGEGRRPAWLCPGASSKRPWEEACYAGVDWSCVSLLWEYC